MNTQRNRIKEREEKKWLNRGQSRENTRRRELTRIRNEERRKRRRRRKNRPYCRSPPFAFALPFFPPKWRRGERGEERERMMTKISTGSWFIRNIVVYARGAIRAVGPLGEDACDVRPAVTFLEWYFGASWSSQRPQCTCRIVGAR